MYKTLQEALGLGRLDTDKLKQMLTGEGEHIPGYDLDYRIWEIDGVTISVPESHGSTHQNWGERGFGHKGKTFWHFTCNDMERDGYVWASPFLYAHWAGTEFPLRLSNPEFNGLIIGEPKDELAVRTSFVPAKMKLLPMGSRRITFKMSRCQVRDSGYHPELEIILVRLKAPVTSFRLTETPHLVSKQSLNLQVATPYGILDVFYALKNAKELEKIQAALKQNDNGLVLDAIGWLIGDLATGRYKKGPKYDLPHNLRLAGIAIAEYCSEELLSKVLSDDAVLIINGRTVRKGASEIYEWFESHLPYVDNPELTFSYAWKRKKSGPILRGITLTRDDTDYDREMFLTAEMGADNRLSVLRIAYVDRMTLEYQEFSGFNRGPVVYGDGDYSVEACEDEIKAAWKDLNQDRVKMLTHLNGDFWLFDGEECADTNGIEALLRGEINDEAVRKVLDKGMADGEPKGQVENLLLYETKHHPGFCFGLDISTLDSEEYPLEIYPVPALPGVLYSGKAEVLATRDLDGRLAGDIAVRLLKNHGPLICRVPDLKLHPVLPGDEVRLEIYGIATRGTIQPHEPINIDGLKTDPSDAKVIVAEYIGEAVDFGGPIESVDHVDLYGEPLVSFKVPLQRSNGKTVFVQVYANKESVSADVKPGDILEGGMILMARIHSDSDDIGS